MKRFLLLLCISALCPLSVVGCGDDSSGGDGVEDGGVTPGDLDEVNNRVDDIEGNLTGLTDDVQGLGDELGELGDQLDELSEDAQARLDALENPDILSCSETASCIPDGLDLATLGVGDIVEKLCSLEVDCCSDNELNYKFGPGITSVEDCVELFTDIVNNGQSPYFLEQGGWIVEQVVNIAHALNDTDTRVELNQDGLDACLATLEENDCDQYVEESEGPEYNNCSEYPNANTTTEDPCYITNIVTGLEAVGETCDPTNQWNFGFSECAPGNYCQYLENTCGYGQACEGICVALPAVGDRCLEDSDCYADETFDTELYCDRSAGECQPLGDLGDDCQLIDPTFASGYGDLNPYEDSRSATSVDCKYGLRCSAVTSTCVADCSEDAYCTVPQYYGNIDGDPTFSCPTGTVCNIEAYPNLDDNYSYSWSYWLGVCTAPVANGQPCTGDEHNYQCASNRCEYDEVDDRYECIAALAAVGADCVNGSDCVTGGCGSDGKCAAFCNCEGDNCDNYEGDGAVPCAAGHYCSDDEYACDEDEENCDYLCEPVVANGDGCLYALDSGWDATCASGYCNTEIETCEAKVAVNVACPSGRNEQCPANHYCGYDASDDNSQCKPYLAAGATCEGDDELQCGDGLYCVYSESGNDTCQAYAGLGDACSDIYGDGLPYCDEGEGLDCIDVDGSNGSGTANECYGFGQYPDGADCYNYDPYCASGFCQYDISDDNYNCAQPIAAGEDCDTNDPTMDKCANGFYCAWVVNDDEDRDGTCEPQGLAGDPCDPRFDGNDCLRNASCELRHDGFFCAGWAIPEETVLCDGE